MASPMKRPGAAMSAAVRIDSDDDTESESDDGQDVKHHTLALALRVDEMSE
jgi:hypothetical protein